MDYKKLQDRLLMKAWKDPKFKERLLKNPKKTIEAFIKEETGKTIELPKNFKIRVIEEEKDTLTILLPHSPAEGQEISQDELRGISGGSGDYMGGSDDPHK